MPALHSIIYEIETRLKSIYDDPILCQQSAWWLLSKLTGMSQAQLIEHQTIELSDQQMQIIRDWLAKLTDQRMPLQYLLGSVPFNNIDILVEPPVLIPRPETEEWTVKLAKQLQQLPDKKISILDLCTGTGCIAIALAKSLPQAKITATDIDKNALRCAAANIAHNNVKNVQLIESDLFSNIPQFAEFDLIVGNPPYIEESEWTKLDQSVTKWEAKHALVSSCDGLCIISKIIKEASRYIKTNDQLESLRIPQLVLEIGHKQGKEVKKLLQQSGYCDIVIEKDLEGKDRVGRARVKPCGMIH